MSLRSLTLKWQTILILTGTLLLSHLIALFVYSADRSQTLVAADTLDLAERIAGYVELAADRSGEARLAVLEAANSRYLRVETQDAAPRQDCPDFSLSGEVDSMLRALMPEGVTWRSCILPIARSALVRGHGLAEPQRRVLQMDFAFPDGENVRFEGVLSDEPSFLWDSAALYILFSVLMVGTAAYVLMGRATRPIRLFAAQASEVGRQLDAPPLDETGPADVRAAARAFNQMQDRLRRLISGRTQMLAAISHDMRTPLTRLRLRIELLEAGTERDRLLRTLEEMETMVLSVLQFIGGSTPAEPPRDIDITALVDSICMDMAATGLPVAFEGPSSPLCLRCRPAVLRRAVENLIDNAVRYGRLARVRIAHDDDKVRIMIRDEGPGVPEESMEQIVQPFVRGEASRSRDTGGHGLGLSTALTIAHAHGGDLLLENLPDSGGFRATIVLPR